MSILTSEKSRYLYYKDRMLWLFIYAHITHKGLRLTFNKRHYLKEIYSDKSDHIVIKKSTQCFHPETRILTETGYRKISEIEVGCKVLTKDSGFQKVKKVFKNRADKLILVRADNVDNILTTKDHPFFTYEYNRDKYHYSRKDKTFSNLILEKIDEINNGSFLIHPKGFSIHTNNHINLLDYNDNVVEDKGDYFRIKNGQRFLPKKIEMNYNSGVLFGFYLSEGHARKKGTNVGFSFGISEKNYVKQVSDILLDVFNINVNIDISDKDNCIRMNFSDRAIHNVFKEMGKDSGDRKPLEEFYSAPDEFLKGMIYGIFCGDGRLKNNQVSLHVKSNELRYFAKWVLSKFGYVSRNNGNVLSVSSDGSKFIKKICNYTFSGKYSRSIELENEIAVRLREKKEIEYNGYVYNLHVENDNTYIANGYIVHNCGISEFLIVYTINECLSGRNVFYVLPTHDIMRRFSINRLDKSLNYSEYYRSLLSVDEGKRVESMSLKDIATGNVALVGSNTPVPFTEYPADTLVVDEEDRCNLINLEMGVERLSAAERQRQIRISNPTLINYGIDKDYNESDKKKWCIQCSSCSKYIFPDFYTHIVRQEDEDVWVVLDPEWDRDPFVEINAICNLCHRPFYRFEDGVWIDEVKSHISGYHISKMFSTNVTTNFLFDRFEKGLANPTIMERFNNADLGLAHESEGSQISLSALLNCMGEYNLAPDGMASFTKDGIVVSGIDVGNKLHVRIDKILQDGRTQALFIGSVNEFEDYIRLHKIFKVDFGVVDSLPEKRLSRKLCATLPNMFRCFYSYGKKDVINAHDKIITVDRTAALDSVYEMFATRGIVLPQNIQEFTEYQANMFSSTRLYDEEKEKYDWVHTDPDHFFHAEAYKELAKRVALLRY